EEQTTEEEQKPADEQPEDTTAAATPAPVDGTPATDTGIEGVAVVMGAAVLAAGAVIISKKRK
ncbi:MAG: NPXTG-anchored protein, partial [Ruminiclostridium sp.]|nr:NPXTG-anchored protein [Ruminiclostridium sp.]